MNIQQCVSINNALTTIDNSLTSTLKTINKMSSHFKGFQEQKDIVTDAYTSIDDAKKKLADLRNTQLSIKVNDDVKTIREDNPVILEMLRSCHWRDRYIVARLGFHLGKLKKDADIDVRSEVANQGAYLDELQYDGSEQVRITVRRKITELEEQENSREASA